MASQILDNNIAAKMFFVETCSLDIIVQISHFLKKYAAF